jgi:hypothetical protein
VPQRPQRPRTHQGKRSSLAIGIFSSNILDGPYKQNDQNAVLRDLY